MEKEADDGTEEVEERIGDELYIDGWIERCKHRRNEGIFDIFYFFVWFVFGFFWKNSKTALGEGRSSLMILPYTFYLYF